MEALKTRDPIAPGADAKRSGGRSWARGSLKAVHNSHHEITVDHAGERRDYLANFIKDLDSIPNSVKSLRVTSERGYDD